MTSLRAERERAEADRRRGMLRIGIAAGVVVAALVGLVLLAGGRPVPPGRAAYDAGTTDPVAAALPVLTGFAESSRGLRFSSPPKVEAVDAATYAKVVAEPITAADGTPIGDRAATRRALALGHLAAAPETGPSAAAPDAAVPGTAALKTGVLRTAAPQAAAPQAAAPQAAAPQAAAPDPLPEAFYSFQRHAVFLRQGRPFDAFARVVLVHELTHALQDQRFDLLGLARAAAGDADRARALAAVIEGDATRVELAYLATQPPTDQTAVRARYDYDPTPRTFAELDRSFSYTVGRDFVVALADKGGNAAVDAAFRRPPASTAQVIDPRDYTGGVEPVGVRAPPAEGQRLDSGTLGQFGLAALVTRGMRVMNVSSTSGWLGDSYVTFRSARGLCTYANVIVTDSEQREQLVRDLAAWVSSRKGRSEVVRNGERGIRLRSCA